MERWYTVYTKDFIFGMHVDPGEYQRMRDKLPRMGCV